MLAVAGHQAISPDIARRSFSECEMWPTKFHFMAPFGAEMSPKSHLSFPFLPSSDMPGQKSNIPSSLSARYQNEKLMRRIQNLSNGCLPSGKALAKIAMLAKTKYRVTKILEKVVRPPRPAPSRIKRGPQRKLNNKAVILTSALRKMPVSENRNAQFIFGHCREIEKLDAHSLPPEPYFNQHNIAELRTPCESL